MHIHVIMNDACHNGQHLLLSISSIKPDKYHDPACVLPANSHLRIVKDSFVYYREPQLRHNQHIIKCVDGGAYVRREDFAPDVFNRIAAGIEASEHSEPWVIDYFRNHGQFF